MTSRELPKGIVVAINHEDKPYLPRFTPALGGIKSKVFAGEIVTMAGFCGVLKKAGVKHVVTTRLDILKKILPEGRAAKANINNYAGSMLEYGEFTFLFVHPMKQLISKSFGDFLNRRYVSKMVRPKKWRVATEFDWIEIATGTDFHKAQKFLSESDIIGVDVETVRRNTAIRCAGYCGIQLGTGKAMGFVIPIESEIAVARMRTLNKIEVPKVMQNGKYDLSYFARYSAPMWGYYYDTVNMMHSWYSELPKDLANVSSLLMRDSMYWKDLASTGDRTEYFRYNALDCWATAESALSWLLEAPDWAKKNYLAKFPLNFPSHMCEMRGMKRDPERLEEHAGRGESKQTELLAELQAGTGYPNFNPSSPKQVLQLLKILGIKEAEDSSEKSLVAAGLRHPLADWFTSRILSYRGIRKLTSTYLKTGADSSEFKGRTLYSLNPHGTDTGRNASKSHHFWCGLQMQNIPKEPEDGIDVKATLCADEGFELWEADYAQAEDRGVAYSSGDKNLLEIFNSGVDSHKYKASMFFGVPYEEVTKEMRQLGKRVNHGANYNMGARVLLETMGAQAVYKAQRLLGLPSRYTLLEVCEALLLSYKQAFPVVKSSYYNSIKNDIRKTNKLVGATGWTRYCFGDPSKSKLDLNSYIAHVTQSLNAMILDIAFKRVFVELAFNPDFKLMVQIHDSILFQTRNGRDDLAEKVKELMTFPVDVTDCKGITRAMTVPVDLDRLGKYWRGNE